nr:P80 family lipoprotein [Mycoplasmopsis bovis]
MKTQSAKNSRLHILGVDDVSGLIQSLPYAMINADANDFFIQTGLVKNKTTVNYKKIKDKNNKSVKALSEIYNKFKESLATKSLTLPSWWWIYIFIPNKTRICFWYWINRWI